MPSKAQREADKRRQAERVPELQPSLIEANLEDEELDTVFADFPQNENCIDLWRVLPQGGHPKFLDQMSPVEFSFAHVREIYGGGRYHAKGKYTDGSSRKMSFEIEGDPIPVKLKIPQGQPASAPIVPSFFPPTVPSGDRGQSEGGMKEFQAMMVGMLQQIVTQMQGSEMQMLEKMAKYKELFGAPAQKEAPLDQMINMFTKGIEVSSMNAGGADGGFPWMMILKELKDPLLKVVDTIQMAVTSGKRPAIVNQPAPMVSTVGEPRPTGESGPLPPSEPPKESDMMMLFVRQVMPALINGAARNADPANYVDFLLDQVPTGSYDALRTWLMQPDCLDKLATIEPGIRFQQEWWVSLRSGLLDALNEELGHAVRSLHPEPPTDPSATSPPDSPIVS